MKQAILWFFVNSIVGALVYLGVLYVTFPSDVARDRLVYEANKAGVRMQLEDVKPTWPAGVRFTGVDVYSFSDSAATLKKKGKRDITSEEKGEEPKEPVPAEANGQAPVPGGEAGATADTSDEIPLLTLDSLAVTSLTDTLMSLGKKVEGVKVAAALYGGSLDGTFSMNEEQQELAIDAKDIDLSRMQLKGESFDVKASGLLGLKTDMTLNREKVRESAGTMGLLLDQFVLYKGSKVKGVDIPVDLPMTITGTSWEVKNGRIEVEELKAENPNLTVTITGSIMLNQSFMRSRANLKVALKFDGELKMVGAFMPESAKSPDGVAHYILSGPLNNMRSRPDRLAARRTDRGKGNMNPNLPTGFTPTPREEMDRTGLPRPPIPGGLPGMLGGEGMLQDGIARPPVLDDEERERLREERRKRAEERRKRREELRQRRLEMMNQGGDSGGFVPPMVDDGPFNNVPDAPGEPNMGDDPPPPMEMDE